MGWLGGVTKTASLAIVAACWTSRPAAPHETTPPKHVVHASPIADEPAAPTRPPRTPPPPPTFTQTLTTELRTNGPITLPTYVAGPVVLLDLDTKTFNTLCGVTAQAAARDWGAKLADPSRPQAMCMDSNQTIVCVQVITKSDHLTVGFNTSSTPRLTFATTSTTGPNQRLMSQVAAKAAAASCP